MRVKNGTTVYAFASATGAHVLIAAIACSKISQCFWISDSLFTLFLRQNIWFDSKTFIYDIFMFLLH